jgi:hypothetical protein
MSARRRLPRPTRMRVLVILLPVVAFTGLSLTAALGDSVDVDETAFPWSSVGKIYNSARSSCSGALIARDKVLTAAPAQLIAVLSANGDHLVHAHHACGQRDPIAHTLIVSLYIRNDSNRMERLATRLATKPARLIRAPSRSRSESVEKSTYMQPSDASLSRA